LVTVLGQCSAILDAHIVVWRLRCALPCTRARTDMLPPDLRHLLAVDRDCTSAITATRCWTVHQQHWPCPWYSLQTSGIKYITVAHWTVM